ncbi:unnamed protein product [Rhizoctonia solani]|uniref:Uncharacterized protein n=1 Tax=Rhizoctonia solani TaxID=456999 RepID=A0A8H3GQN0_9AGAM|nr:unnamed protein product [Rhizoctonia solani]
MMLNRHTRVNDKGTFSITQLFVLSTIFSVTPLCSTAKPLNVPHNPSMCRLKRRSKFTVDFRDLWDSISDWAFLMLIITPKPNVRMIHEHRRLVKGVFSILRSLFSSKSETLPSIPPHHIPPTSRVNGAFDQTVTSSSAAPSASSTSENPIQTPARTVFPTNRALELELPSSQSTSPTTARFLTTLNDLEAQMNNHKF